MEHSDVQNVVTDLTVRADTIEIQSTEDYEIAGAFLVECATQAKYIERVFNPIITRAHAAHKEAIAQRDAFLIPLKRAKGKIGLMVGEWDRKLREERDRRDREERDRLRKLEEDRRLAEAAELERVGQTEAAEEIVSAPIHIMPIPQPAVARPAGVSVREEWDFRVADAAGIKREFLAPDEVRIRRVVKSMGMDAIALVGGIEVFTRSITSTRVR